MYKSDTKPERADVGFVSRFLSWFRRVKPPVALYVVPGGEWGIYRIDGVVRMTRSSGSGFARDQDLWEYAWVRQDSEPYKTALAVLARESIAEWHRIRTHCIREARRGGPGK